MDEENQNEVMPGITGAKLDESSRKYVIMSADDVINKWADKTEEETIEYYNSGGNNYEVISGFYKYYFYIFVQFFS